MPAGTLVRTWLLGPAILGSVAGCSDCFLSGESPGLGHTAPMDGVVMWVGDTYTVTATRQEDCETHANSADSPQSFIFASSNASIATFSATGVMTAVAPGTTSVSVSSIGQQVGIGVAVSEPVSMVDITFEPAAPRAGDTVNVRVEGRKADGTPAANAQFSAMKLMIRRDNFSAAGVFLAGATPTTARFIATTPGEYEITSLARRTSGEARTGAKKFNLAAP